VNSADRLELARRMMEWNGLPENQAGKTRKLDLDCLHASLSWGDGQKPDRAEMIEAAQSFLKAIGLEKARAVFIAHDDTDHAHIHIVASRIDPETRRSLRMDYDKIEGQKWAVKWEKDHGQERNPAAGINLHGLIDAIGKRDADAVLVHLTRDKATFSTWDVSKTLRYGDLSKDEQDKFRADILARQNVIGLRATAEAPITRYTTREVLAAEMALQRNASILAEDKTHGVKASRIDKAVADFTLIPEQAEALCHLTGAQGFAVLWGQAGTGKSHTLKAARAVYEAEGKNVIGLSWQNKIVNAMRQDGFTQANTIASELWGLDHGRTRWNAKGGLIPCCEIRLTMRRTSRTGARLFREIIKTLDESGKSLQDVVSCGAIPRRILSWSASPQKHKTRHEGGTVSDKATQSAGEYQERRNSDIPSKSESLQAFFLATAELCPNRLDPFRRVACNPKEKICL
jgi:hypothetical protein